MLLLILRTFISAPPLPDYIIDIFDDLPNSWVLLESPFCPGVILSRLEMDPLLIISSFIQSEEPNFSVTISQLHSAT